jgi:hypothetical protein
MLLFCLAVFRIGIVRASVVFSQRPGLLCILMFGNVFLGGSLLLLYFDLSRLECCDFVHNLDFANLVIMAPVFAPTCLPL